MAAINIKHKTKNSKVRFFKRNNSKEPITSETRKPRQFPSIYRLITESIAFIKKYKKWIGVGMLFICLFVFIGLASVQAYRHYQEKEKVLSERKEVLAKISYWQKVVIEKKGYRDGYFQLAVLWYELGRKDQAGIYLVEVFRLDPNFEEGRRLEKVIREKE